MKFVFAILFFLMGHFAWACPPPLPSDNWSLNRQSFTLAEIYKTDLPAVLQAIYLQYRTTPENELHVSIKSVDTELSTDSVLVTLSNDCTYKMEPVAGMLASCPVIKAIKTTKLCPGFPSIDSTRLLMPNR